MLEKKDLIEYMDSGSKTPENLRVGIEHEVFVYDLKTDAPLPYDGDPGIKQLLETLSGSYGWEPIFEKDNVIALTRCEDNITIEPAGQIEFSGSTCDTLDCIERRFLKYFDELEKACAKLGIGILQKGVHPNWTREDMQWMPKGRYKIMRAYMPKVGTMGLDMMTRTTGAQVNLDYLDEQDAMVKFRLAHALQFIPNALTANSSMLEGKDTGYQSYRSHIWTDTDNQRGGIQPLAFDDAAGFEDYVDYVLDVPMYFYMDNKEYVDVAGLSFRDFIDGKLPGHEGRYPTLSDWKDHVSTHFPEVRVKTYIEIRGADTMSPQHTLAIAAFWKGLFYCPICIQKAWKFIEDWTYEDVLKLRHDVPKLGLEAEIRGQKLKDIALDVLGFANTGLKEKDKKYLQPLYDRYETLTGKKAA